MKKSLTQTLTQNCIRLGAIALVFTHSAGAEDTSITREQLGVPPVSAPRMTAPAKPRVRKATATAAQAQTQARDRAASANRGIVSPFPSMPPVQRPAQRPSGAVPTSSEEAVNLDSPSVNAPAQSTGGQTSGQNATGHGSVVHPGFKFYFDFVYAVRPQVVQPGFDSYHQVIMAEILASPELTFLTEVSTSPRFFEADYTFSPLVTLRWGKIWIPFDDMAPHNIFGGRMNTSKFFEGTTSSPFLPDLWADLGVALKSKLVDTTALELESQIYILNGFKSGGVDPTGEKGDYPDFSNPATGSDNNSDKAFGGRMHADIAKRFGLGGSFYSGRFTDEAKESQRVTMYGADIQFRPTSTIELRGGAVVMNVGLNPPSTKASFKRGGQYVEAGYRFGYQNRFKLLARGGTAQNDSRVIDITDKKIVGGTFLYLVGPIQLSVEHNKDLQKVASKLGYSYTAFRIVTAF